VPVQGCTSPLLLFIIPVADPRFQARTSRIRSRCAAHSITTITDNAWRFTSLPSIGADSATCLLFKQATFEHPFLSAHPCHHAKSMIAVEMTRPDPHPTPFILCFLPLGAKSQRFPQEVIIIVHKQFYILKVLTELTKRKVHYVPDLPPRNKTECNFIK